jgi:hypothetical protein
MKILIVYEEIPERTKTYTVDVTAHEWGWLKQTHGYYLNQADLPARVQTALEKLSVWLEDKPSSDVANEPIDVHDQGFAKVVVTGILL